MSMPSSMVGEQNSTGSSSFAESLLSLLPLRRVDLGGVLAGLEADQGGCNCLVEVDEERVGYLPLGAGAGDADEVPGGRGAVSGLPAECRRGDLVAGVGPVAGVALQNGLDEPADLEDLEQVVQGSLHVGRLQDSAERAAAQMLADEASRSTGRSSSGRRCEHESAGRPPGSAPAGSARPRRSPRGDQVLAGAVVQDVVVVRIKLVDLDGELPAEVVQDRPGDLGAHAGLRAGQSLVAAGPLVLVRAQVVEVGVVDYAGALPAPGSGR